MTPGEELKSLIGSEAQRSALLEQIRTVLPVPLADKVARILELTVWLLALLEKKNLSIAKLKQMIFGAQTESAANLSGKGRKDPKKLKAKGHGRNSHRRYTGARRIRVKHPSLRPGQRCPECAKGKLRERKELALAISVRAQPPVGALIHELEQLTKEAAQAPVLFSDDTGMRVGALRKEIQAETKPKRTGIFTSGIVAKLEDYWVSLFFTGRKHAGENLAQVLEEREAQRTPPLHMCDGLASNDPQGHTTVEAQCNVHARRNFVDLESAFPEECRKVVESFSAIYRVEAKAKVAKLTPEQRLREHQTHSQPVMEELRTWFTDQIDSKKVEPNSGLGKAIEYMRKRWTQLTQFLRIPGAPLDNNEAERVLKRCILHRKNSLHYRTTRGAKVGDLFMSLVETCRANEVNPFDYMLAVVHNAKRVSADPERWMPWNFQATLAEQTTRAG